MIILIEFLVLIVLAACYIIAPSHISPIYLATIISFVALSYLLLYVNPKTKAFYKNHFLSNVNIFLLLFFVVCFQFPIDYAIGNDRLDYTNYFYSMEIINLSTTYNAMCFVAFIIGVMISVKRASIIGSNNCNQSRSIIPTKLLLIIMYVLWFGFLLFLNRDYVNGGHGVVPIDHTSVALYSYFWRLNILYIAINIHQQKQQGQLTIKQAFKTQSILYWTIILITALLFLLAHNRAYTFFVLMPSFFYLLAVTRSKTKPLPSLALICFVGVFFTLFKIFGIERMFSEGSLNTGDYIYYDRFSSFSPFTSELAGSIYADSALFYMWYTRGVVLLGSTLVHGVLRTISGLVPLFYSITGLSYQTYDSASYVTTQLSASYGLGSSATGDLIVSVGFLGALVVMYLFGRLCGYGDMCIWGDKTNFKGILIGICISSHVAFIARGSIGDVISTTLFCLLAFYFYRKSYIRGT